MALVAISYDGQDVLRGFADANGITFPLLADEGSRVIRELGLLDRDLADHHAAFGIPTRDDQWGVAYPAVFVLDEAGRVAQKRIQENYRAREGGRLLLEAALGISSPPPTPAAAATAPRIAVSAWADRDGYVRWQRSRLHVVLDVEAGWHVYGRPVPDGYRPLTVEVTSAEGVEIGEPSYPEGRPFRVEGIDEDFVVNEGRVEVTVPFAANVPPDQGDIVLRVATAFQACSDNECLMPSRVESEITLQQVPPVS